MCLHETKCCPRCKAVFACKADNITQCRCYGIALTTELKVYIEQRYRDCLCESCLRFLQFELDLFKEKYLFGR